MVYNRSRARRRDVAKFHPVQERRYAASRASHFDAFVNASLQGFLRALGHKPSTISRSSSLFASWTSSEHPTRASSHQPGMNAHELARWTRFAGKGGIGKCTAVVDCIAQEMGEDLMFLKASPVRSRPYAERRCLAEGWSLRPR